MSLSRLALRLAVMETLAPHAGFASGLWPTHAGGRIGDSGFSSDSFAESAVQRLPMISVYTDEAKGAANGSAQDVLIDGLETVTLALEVMVPAVLGTGENSFVTEAAGLDAIAEATLDTLEEQIRQRLAEARMSRPLCDILLAIDSVESQPWRDADTDTRLSARRIEFSCRVRATGRLPDADGEGLARLPSPLRDVAEALPGASYGASVCQLVAATIGSAAPLTELAGLRLAANLRRAAGDAPPPAPDARPTPPIGDLGASVPFT